MKNIPTGGACDFKSTYSHNGANIVGIFDENVLRLQPANYIFAWLKQQTFVDKYINWISLLMHHCFAYTLEQRSFKNRKFSVLSKFHALGFSTSTIYLRQKFSRHLWQKRQRFCWGKNANVNPPPLWKRTSSSTLNVAAKSLVDGVVVVVAAEASFWKTIFRNFAFHKVSSISSFYVSLGLRLGFKRF